MILYGRNPVREALRAERRPVSRLRATAGAAREPWLARCDVEVASADELTELAGTTAHQGVVAEAGPYPYVDEATLLDGVAPFLVVLDEVQDVQNLGAVARTAECAGATGLVIGERRSAEVTPAACKASAGAVEHLRIARVRNIADFLETAKEAGCWCYGAAGDGEVAYTEPDYSGAVALVLGAEGKGLRPRVRKVCDATVSVPVVGQVGSLNVGAAAAVVMYEILQNRRKRLTSAP